MTAFGVFQTVFWCLRRHPIQIQNNSYNHQIKFLNELTSNFSNVDWEKSSKLALSSLLEKVKANIQMNTMSCYDCALFGIKSLTSLSPLHKSNLWFS